MPAADASGEVFSLNADGRYEGVVTGRAGAGGQLSVSLEAEACHGLSLEASARALAGANAGVGFLLAARGNVFGTAAAGLAAKAQVRPDAFDRFGLILEAAAFAEASAGGRLAVGLDFGAISRLAQDQLDGLALELFLAFLEEIVLEVGVWGRASAAAMAQAHADITFSLTDDADAGIVIEAGAAAGLGAGMGWDFFGGARFTDVRRFYRRSVRLITKEASAQARAALPPDLRWGAEVLELALPTALESVYELGQRAALQTLAPADQTVGPFLSAFAATVRTYLFDKASAAVPMLLEPLVARVEEVLAGEDEELDLTEVEGRFDALVEHVEANLGREIELEDLPVLAGLVLDVVEAAIPDEAGGWREAAAIVWTSLAAVDALERPLLQTTTSVSGVGLGGVPAPDQTFELPAAPNFVLEAYHERLGRNLTRVEFGDAVDFLVDVLADVLAEVTPGAGFVLDDLAGRFDLSAGELVETGLRLSFGGDLTALPAYEKVRQALEDWLDAVIAGEVLPILRTGLGDQGGNYVAEVAAPSLDALSSFVLAKLDAVVSGVSSGQATAFQEKLSAGCSTLVYRMFVRNALFLESVLFEHVLDGLGQAFEVLEAEVRTRDDHVLTTTLSTLLPTLYPGNPTVAAANAESVAELVATMASVGRDAFGVRVWSFTRRRRLRELKQSVLLGVEGDGTFDDRPAVEELLSDLVLCEYVPNAAAVEELTALLGEILLDVAEVVIPRGLSAWSTFLLSITRSVVEEIDRVARELLTGAAALVDAALAELLRLGRELDAAIEAAKQAGLDLAAALRGIEDSLSSTSRRQTIKDALRTLGAAEAEKTVRDLHPPAEDLAVAIAVDMFHVAFSLIEPVLDLAFEAAEAVAGSVADLIEGAVNAADALEAIVDAVIDEALSAVTFGLSDLGLTLPSELSAQDIANAIADALPTSLLLSFLDGAIAASQANDIALANEADAEQRKATAADAHQRRLAEEAALQPAGAVSVVIGSPLPPPRDVSEAFVHGPEVPVLVRVKGASASFFSAGRSRRVRLAVNGVDVAYRASDWRSGIVGYEYTEPLFFEQHGLSAGLNVLEVSAVDGLGAIVRHTVGFIVDPHAPSLRGSIAVDESLSVFDTTGDDHERAEQERVAFRWTGRRTLPIDGWRVRDRGGKHTYVFGEASLDPGAAIMLRTGGASSADDRLAVHWGRRRAVWNNRAGDTVLLVDGSGFVRATFEVPPRRRSR